MTAPAALHRILFGRQKKDVVVHLGDVFAKAGLAAMGLTLATVVLLIFAVVLGDTAAIVACAVVLVFYVVAWVVLPMSMLRRGTEPQ